MNPDEALPHIRGLAAAGRYYITRHARQRMAERNVREAELAHALVHATGCRATSDDAWKVEGPDLDGDDLTTVSPSTMV